MRCCFAHEREPHPGSRPGLHQSATARRTRLPQTRFGSPTSISREGATVSQCAARRAASNERRRGEVASCARGDLREQVHRGGLSCFGGAASMSPPSRDPHDSSAGSCSFSSTRSSVFLSQRAADRLRGRMGDNRCVAGACSALREFGLGGRRTAAADASLEGLDERE